MDAPTSSYEMTSAEGEVLLEAYELAYQLLQALQQPPASSLCNSGQAADVISRVQSLLQSYKAEEDNSVRTFSWGTHGLQLLKWMLDRDLTSSGSHCSVTCQAAWLICMRLQACICSANSYSIS